MTVIFLNRDRNVSIVSIFGGVLGACGFLAIPALRPYALAPLLLDPGTCFALAFGIPTLMKEIWRSSSFNLVSEFVGHAEQREITIRQFRYSSRAENEA